MARPPTLLLRREDYAEVKEDWIDRLIRSLNLFAKVTTAALSKGLTFQDNVNCFLKTVETKTDGANALVKVTLSNELPAKAKPVGVLLVAARVVDGEPVSLGSPSWTTGNEGVIIMGVSGTAASTRYEFTFLVLGG